MKTLLERLKPEIKEIFDAEKSKHPNIIELIYKEFDNSWLLSDVRFGRILDIVSIPGLKEHFNCSYQDMYQLSILNNMFNRINE